jgi:hypothetical protein
MLVSKVVAERIFRMPGKKRRACYKPLMLEIPDASMGEIALSWLVRACQSVNIPMVVAHGIKLDVALGGVCFLRQCPFN